MPENEPQKVKVYHQGDAIGCLDMMVVVAAFIMASGLWAIARAIEQLAKVLQ